VSLIVQFNVFAEPLFSVTPRQLLYAQDAKLCSASPQEERLGSLRAAPSGGRLNRAVLKMMCTEMNVSLYSSLQILLYKRNWCLELLLS
jgi:hypothetical protein